MFAGHSFQLKMLSLHPFTYFAALLQKPIYYGVWPSALDWGVSVSISLFSFSFRMVADSQIQAQILFLSVTPNFRRHAVNLGFFCVQVRERKGDGVNDVFRVENITVSFEKDAILQRSLRYALHSALRGAKRTSFDALKEVSANHKEGEHIGIIGRNGAGKSTLLRVLTGVIVPQKGSVSPTQKNTSFSSRARNRIYGDLSGRENCYLAASLMGYSKADIDKKNRRHYRVFRTRRFH